MMVQEARRLDRTWLCSVVFLDIVDYSSQPVDTQIGWKTFFNDCLAEVLRSVGTDDRVVLDTGDGAVICFLGDPETALVSSLSILNRFKEKDAGTGKGPQIRIGINLGPIRLLSDINGNLNAVGDGINVGQRIMAFAGGNQLLISRSYFEVISRLTEDYEKMFRFDGVRQDKHIREHAVYALVGPAHDNGRGGSADLATPEIESQESPKQSTDFEPRILSVIENCLAATVGPIAGRLVKTAARQASSVAELCERLAADAVPERERGNFLKHCRGLLGQEYQGPQAPVPVFETAKKPADKVAQQWDESVLERFRALLAEYVGPIAKMMVARAAAKVRTKEELCATLAEQIPSDKERAVFVAKCRI